MHLYSQCTIQTIFGTVCVQGFILFLICIQNQIATGFKKQVWKISTAETKIILVLCYFALFGLVSLSYFAIETANQDDVLVAIQQYFVCEAVGSGTECDRSGFDHFGLHGLTVFVYLLLGLIPAVNLTFVINWTAAKESCKHFWIKYFPNLKTTTNQSSITINQNRTLDTVETNV